MILPGAQYYSPPTTGYYTYGAASPQNGKLPPSKSDAFLEQGEAVDFMKAKANNPGFLGFSSVDVVAMMIILFVPLLIFAAVYALVSFYFHYKYAVLAWTLILVIFAAVAYMGYVSVSRMLQEADGFTDHYAVWAAAVFIGVNLAFFSSLVFGYRNYGHYTQPYYERLELNSYKDVDPSTTGGKAFMDAGAVTFKPGSHLDLAKSTGFMNLNMYCVAPIVSQGKAPASYDFWAVGLNCCTGATQNFACGESSSLKTDLTTGGLRLMSGSELPFYKLAVTQAASNYGIETPHPIFFEWVQDTTTAIADSRKHGIDSFLPALAFFTVFQAFVLGGAALVVVIVTSRYKGLQQ